MEERCKNVSCGLVERLIFQPRNNQEGHQNFETACNDCSCGKIIQLLQQYSQCKTKPIKQLSNDRAFKLVYVSLNLKLLAQTKRNHANKIIHTELEKTSNNAQHQLK